MDDWGAYERHIDADKERAWNNFPKKMHLNNEILPPN